MASQATCPRCSKILSPGEDPCGRCGEGIDWSDDDPPGRRLAPCSDCAKLISRGADFCPHCGLTFRRHPEVTIGTIALGSCLGMVLFSLIPIVILVMFWGTLAAIFTAAAARGY